MLAKRLLEVVEMVGRHRSSKTGASGKVVVKSDRDIALFMLVVDGAIASCASQIAPHGACHHRRTIMSLRRFVPLIASCRPIRVSHPRPTASSMCIAV